MNAGQKNKTLLYARLGYLFLFADSMYSINLVENLPCALSCYCFSAVSEVKKESLGKGSNHNRHKSKSVMCKRRILVTFGRSEK